MSEEKKADDPTTSLGHIAKTCGYVTVILGCIAALISGGITTYKWAFPNQDFQVSSEIGKLVLPDSLKAGSTFVGKDGKENISLTNYLVISLTNKAGQRLEDVKLHFKGDGVAEVKDEHGETKEIPYKAVLALGDMSPSTTITATVWNRDSSSRVLATHKTGEQTVFVPTSPNQGLWDSLTVVFSMLIVSFVSYDLGKQKARKQLARK